MKLNHAIGLYMASKDFESVEAATEKFLSEVVEK
jgi:hypothetical protein